MIHFFKKGKKEKETESAEGKKTLLVIDDNADFTNAVEKYLTGEGYHVLVASNGKDGLKLTKKKLPHLVLLDIIMPGLDGFQVLSKIKTDQKTSRIPVIMLTWRDDDEAKLRSAELYDSDYITKDSELEVLGERIRKTLDLMRT